MLIKAKYSKDKAIKGIDKKRDLHSILKSIVGMLSIYLGFDAAFLFLCDVGVINN